MLHLQIHLGKLDYEEVIHSLISALNKHYVFPEVANELDKYLKTKLMKKEYESIKSCDEFCIQVTKDLQKISNDKHLRLRFSEDERSTSQKISEEEQRKEYMLQAQIENYGFHKVERLQGNIGYIDIRGFYSPELGGETAVNVMNMVSNTDALIFDLRNNGGGSPLMVALIISYLFDSEPVHLNNFYLRKDEFISQSWTLPYVPGKRYGDKPVFVLTSWKTFSAAEEFAYNLKNLNRATIIGEVTGGGANPGKVHQLTKHFSAFIPDGRAINPISQTNWEGKGVTPDIEVTQGEAFKMAYEHALHLVYDKYKGKKQYGFLLKEVEACLKQIEKD